MFIMKSLHLSIIFLNLFFNVYQPGNSCSSERKRKVHEWNEYKYCFQQTFHPDDDGDRESIFKENVEKVKLLNSKNPKVVFGMNRFSHLTLDEFKKKHLTYKGEPVQPEVVLSKETFNPVDWRLKHAVTKVKNQKNCGSCYAFSAIGAIESAYAIKHKKKIVLSEEQIVDCSRSYGNNGCDGGLMEAVFKYVIDFGSMGSHDYPYAGKETACEYNMSKVVTKIKDFKSISSGSENELTMSLRKIGPVSVAIDAGLDSFMFYEEGIFSDVECSSTELNHGVLAVGVTNEYYIVKNSWGREWGMAGYINIARNKNNMCGIASQASYPVI